MWMSTVHKMLYAFEEMYRSTASLYRSLLSYRNEPSEDYYEAEDVSYVMLYIVPVHNAFSIPDLLRMNNFQLEARIIVNMTSIYANCHF